MNPLSAEWMPYPPVLQRAIDDGHVCVANSTQGRVYAVSKRCPNLQQVKRAIAWRKKLELAWAAVITFCATTAIVALARWSNTL